MRPKKLRNICCDIIGERLFAPKCIGNDKNDTVHISLDEFEAIRMCDQENMKQEEVAEIMNVHRTTVSRILTSAHQKIADALINLKEIRISGGCCTYKQGGKEMKKVLFVCIHNSARSQMAEAFVNKYGNGEIVAESAGLEPGKLNPIVVEVMKEIGIDISNNPTKSVFEFYKKGNIYTSVITVCDEASGEQCPIFPGITERLHWGFPDPSSFQGSHEEKLIGTRKVRDEIEEKIKAWIEGK